MKIKIEGILLTVIIGLTLSANLFAQQNWNGTWNIKYRHSSSTLDIKKVSKTKFNFSISAFSGTHDGEISGTATVAGKTATFLKRDNSTKELCKIKFLHTGKSIKIDQDSCEGYGGVGVYFGGEYKKGEQIVNDSLITYGIFPNKKTDDGFRKLVGKDYENFMDNLHLIAENENADSFNAKVFSGFVRGLAPYNAAIIMFDKNNTYWAAYIELNDKDEAKIYYYSNSANWKNKLPKTIETWVEDKREVNKNLQIVYKNQAN